MSKIKYLIVIPILFIAIKALYAEDPPKDNFNTVKIGVIAGLSGEYAATFQNWVNGITLAYETYKLQNKKPIVKLTVEDDGFSPSKGLKAYKKLTVVDHIDALINGSSATIGAISPLVVKKDFPVIQLGEETTAPANDNIFQISPGNIEAEIALGEHLSKLYPNNLALFYTTNSTMSRFADAFKKGYKSSLAEYEMDPQLTDLKSLVTRALSKKPWCVAILAFPAQGALLVKELRSVAPSKINFAFDGNFQTGFTEYQRLLGDLSFLDNDIVMKISVRTNPSFVEKYRQYFKQEPGVAADLGYDSFNLLMAKYSDNRSEWKTNIRLSDFEGASGNIIFNDVGIRKPEFKVLAIRDLKP